MTSNIDKRRTITPKQASEIYGVSIGWLANLRSAKRGCKYYLVGSSKVVYRVDEFENWLLQNPVLTTDSIEEK